MNIGWYANVSSRNASKSGGTRRAEELVRRISCRSEIFFLFFVIALKQVKQTKSRW